MIGLTNTVLYFLYSRQTIGLRALSCPVYVGFMRALWRFRGPATCAPHVGADLDMTLIRSLHASMSGSAAQALFHRLCADS